MAFDSTGNLFVSDYNGNFITKFTPDGAGSVAVPEPSTFALLGAGLLTLLAGSMAWKVRQLRDFPQRGAAPHLSDRELPQETNPKSPRRVRPPVSSRKEPELERECL